MSSNNFKLGLLLGLQFNHYLKDCPCQRCTYSCHKYRLLHNDKLFRTFNLKTFILLINTILLFIILKISFK